MSSQGSQQSMEEILGRVPLFSRLGGRDLRKLGRLCVPRSFTAGDVVIEEGAVGLGMFVLTGGRVEVYKTRDADRLVLGTMEAGDVLGEIALIDDQPRSASAVALEDTECLLLTKDSFDLLVRKEPEIAWCIVPSLAERVRELHEKALRAEDRVRELEEDGASAADAADEAESEMEEADWVEGLTRFARLQYGMMAGGAAAMSGMARAAEEFVGAWATDADLAESDSPSELAARLPDGLVSALRTGWKTMEDVPQEVLDKMRKYSDDGP